MTQQETHPSTSPPPSPQWYGEPTPWRGPTSANDPFAPPGSRTAEPPTMPGSGIPTGPSQPEAPGGGGGEHPAYPPPAPVPPPRNRPGRRLAELSAVAVLAAALASGGTFAATRYTDASPTTTSPQTSVAGSPNPAPPIVQANGSAPDWTATAKAVSPSVVSIAVTGRQAAGQGSGVVVDKAGHILTNNHVATGAGANAAISVTLNDGRTYDAKIVGTDPTTDLAVLAIVNPPADLTPISFGDSGQLTVGQPVMAVGNPLGLAGTVTTGIVSALNRPVTTGASPQQGAGGNPVVTNAIQTSAAINPGNSGGPLFNFKGEVVGVTNMKAAQGDNLGFAIPINYVKDFLRNREAFAFDKDNPNTGYRYLDPPRRLQAGTPPGPPGSGDGVKADADQPAGSS